MKNMIIRTLSGICFLTVMVGGLLWNKYSFAILMAVAMTMMMMEFFRMTMGSEYRFSRVLAILSGLTLFILSFLHSGFGLPASMLILSFIPLFIVMIDSLYVKDKTSFGKFSNLYTGLLYIAIPVSMSNIVVFNPQGVYDGTMLLSFFILIWTSDVGAYIFGITIGQKYGHKLCPSISPNKSWAGFWGGLALTIAMAVVLHYTGIMNYSLLHCIVLSVIIDIAGVYGDLIESQWKRHYEVKDSGRSIPGHGGFLDRFDSALTSIPAAIVYMVLIHVL